MKTIKDKVNSILENASGSIVVGDQAKAASAFSDLMSHMKATVNKEVATVAAAVTEPAYGFHQQEGMQMR